MPQFMRPMLTLTITATSSMYESSIHWYPHLTSSNIEVKTVCISHNFPWYTVSAHTAIILNLILCAYVAQSPRRAVWGPGAETIHGHAGRACDTVSCQFNYVLWFLDPTGSLALTLLIKSVIIYGTAILIILPTLSISNILNTLNSLSQYFQ